LAQIEAVPEQWWRVCHSSYSKKPLHCGHLKPILEQIQNIQKFAQPMICGQINTRSGGVLVGQATNVTRNELGVRRAAICAQVFKQEKSLNGE
jgi:hypothetical protein